MFALRPDKNKFEHWVLDLYQDQPVSCMMQETIAEGRLILSKFWHKFQKTKENLCEQYEGVFIQAGQNCIATVRIYL